MTRSDWSSCDCFTHQASPCFMAWVSAVKLEAFGPAKERNEMEVFPSEFMAYSPVLPVQNRKG